MIYTISEHAATAADSIILVMFLIKTLAFRENNKNRNSILSVVFMTSFFIITTLLNSYHALEGILSFAYILILFLFARLVLQGRWWYQFLLVLVEFASIFLVNAVISIISASILNKEYSDLLMMRNPARIFLLFLSKMALIGLLIPISNSIRKKKFILHLTQYIVSIISLIVTIIAGIIIEKMIFDNLIPVLYASIIMVCLATIDILFLYILFQFTAHNQSVLNQVALETRLRDEEIKRKEMLQWNNSVRTLQHDLNNHMATVAQYIENGSPSKAIEYINKITYNISNFPKFTNTTNPTLNAMVDLKRMICQKEGIDLKCYIQNDLLDFDDTAFSTIFGNLMDNAIEAERKEKQKLIKLSLEIVGSYLHITVQNKIEEPVLVNGKIPDTTKSDKRNHGLGMYSVTETISRNGGVLDISEQDGWFIVDALLPCNI